MIDNSIREFTEQIIPSIRGIDQGCETCIQNFLCGYNAALIRCGAGFTLKYEASDGLVYFIGADLCQ